MEEAKTRAVAAADAMASHGGGPYASLNDPAAGRRQEAEEKRRAQIAALARANIISRAAENLPALEDAKSARGVRVPRFARLLPGRRSTAACGTPNAQLQQQGAATEFDACAINNSYWTNVKAAS